MSWFALLICISMVAMAGAVCTAALAFAAMASSMILRSSASISHSSAPLLPPDSPLLRCSMSTISKPPASLIAVTISEGVLDFHTLEAGVNPFQHRRIARCYRSMGGTVEVQPELNNRRKRAGVRLRFHEHLAARRPFIVGEVGNAGQPSALFIDVLAAGVIV